MTEKRFTKQEVYDGINRYKINESNFIVEILDDGIPMHYSTIVNRLNEQHKTITRLEKENEQLKDKYNEQSVEYEGLEEQVERLLDFRDNVFNLINKKLKEADKGFEQTYDEWYQGQVDALKELKKELITGESK